VVNGSNSYKFVVHSTQHSKKTLNTPTDFPKNERGISVKKRSRVIPRVQQASQSILWRRLVKNVHMITWFTLAFFHQSAQTYEPTHPKKKKKKKKKHTQKKQTTRGAI